MLQFHGRFLIQYMAQILNRYNKMKHTYENEPTNLFLSYCHCCKRCDLFLVSWGRPCIFQLSKKLQKKKKKRQRRSGRHRTIPREGAAPSENSADIRNVSCFGFHKALRGLGLPFPAARIIVLQFQSDISISLQTDPSLQGSPLGIKQLGGSKRVVMSQIKLNLNRK